MGKNQNKEIENEKYYTAEEVVAMLKPLSDLLKETIKKMKEANNK